MPPHIVARINANPYDNDYYGVTMYDQLLFDINHPSNSANRYSAVGVSFKGDGSQITQVQFRLRNDSSFLTNAVVRAEIYASKGDFGVTSGLNSDLPTGVALAQSQQVTNTTMINNGWVGDFVSFNFSPPFQTINGQHYYIVLRTVSGFTQSDSGVAVFYVLAATNSGYVSVNCGSNTFFHNNNWNPPNSTSVGSSRHGFIVTVYGEFPTAKVTYDDNGATGGSVPVDNGLYEENVSVTVLANSGGLVRSGYVFKGWAYSASATVPDFAVSGSSVSPSTFLMGASNVILFAVWAPLYSVTYNGNGHTGGSAPSDSNLYEQGASVPVAVNTGNLVKTNWTFKGWATNSSAASPDFAVSGSSVSPSTFLMGNANVVLYAVWQENPKFKVTYDAGWISGQSGSGTVPVDYNSPYYVGSTVTVLGNVGGLTCTLHNFKGWHTSKNQSTPLYVGGSTFTITEDTVLYAVWEEYPKYKVEYNGNGNTSGSAPVDGNSPYYLGYSATVLGQGSLLKSNYAFLGWSTNASASSAEFTQGQTFAISKDTMLYAVWQEYPKYSVTYDDNGATSGSVPVDNGLYYQGTTVTVQANPGELAKDDDGLVSRKLPSVVTYAFLGWAYLSNASVPDFAVSGSTVSPSTFLMGNANVTLYAVWEKIVKYEVTYDDNGATSGYAPVDGNSPYLYGATVTVLGQGSMLREDHIFLGWSTNQLAVSPQYLPSQKFTLTQDVTLYAVWRRDDEPPPQVFHVYYDSNAPSGVTVTGLVPVDEGLYLEEQTVTVQANPGGLACATFKFLGWAKVSNASEPAFVVSGNTVTPGSFVMGAVDVTLYAVWQAVPLFSVVYQPNGATSGAPPVDGETYVDGASVTVLGQGSLIRKNYSFLGWNVNSSSTTALYLPGATFTIVGGSVVLFAIWREDTKYSVTYHGNGASGGVVPVDVNSPYYAGSNVGVLNQGTLVRDGYKFLGWATTSSALTAQYTAGDVFTIGAANVVLYAVWQLIPLTYTVEYRANWPNNETGLGSPPLDVTEYVVGATVTVQANPNNLTLSGYRLRGWSSNQYATAPSFVISGNSVVPSTFIMGSINVVLYAVWEKIQYHQVIYRDNNAETGTAPLDWMQYEQGETVRVLANTGNLARHGYLFIGWATTATATVPDYVVSNNGYVQPSTFVMPAATVYLYPVWQQIVMYTVTYHPNNATTGEVPENQNKFMTGSIVSVRPNIKNLARIGYIFMGWATSATATTPDYIVDGNIVSPASFIITGNVDLYAVWQARVHCSITYDPNWPLGIVGSGTAPIDSGTYFFEDTTHVLANPGKLTASGYTFIGWMHKTIVYTVNGDTVTPQTITLLEDTTLYAVWRLDVEIACKHNGKHYGETDKVRQLCKLYNQDGIKNVTDQTLDAFRCIATEWANGELDKANVTPYDPTATAPEMIHNCSNLYAAGRYLMPRTPEEKTHPYIVEAQKLMDNYLLEKYGIGADNKTGEKQTGYVLTSKKRGW